MTYFWKHDRSMVDFFYLSTRLFCFFCFVYLEGDTFYFPVHSTILFNMANTDTCCWWPLCDSLWLCACYISEDHARLSGPPHQRDTLGKERFLVSCACVRWACCGRNALVPKPPGRTCQEGGIHPSPVWVSALFWWWWSFPSATPLHQKLYGDLEDLQKTTNFITAAGLVV